MVSRDRVGGKNDFVLASVINYYTQRHHGFTEEGFPRGSRRASQHQKTALSLGKHFTTQKTNLLHDWRYRKRRRVGGCAGDRIMGGRMISHSRLTCDHRHNNWHCFFTPLSSFPFVVYSPTRFIHFTECGDGLTRKKRGKTPTPHPKITNYVISIIPNS